MVSKDLQDAEYEKRKSAKGKGIVMNDTNHVLNSDGDFMTPTKNVGPKLMDDAIREVAKRNYVSNQFATHSGDDVDTKNTITFRASPNVLKLVLNVTNDYEKKAIRDMGFGDLIKLNIDMIPKALGRWLVDHFDANTCSLMHNNTKLEITGKSLHYILGVPNGNIKINLVSKASNKGEYTQLWKNQFGGEGKRIYLPQVVEKLLEGTRGCINFKLNFLVLFVSVMGESIKMGTANYQFMSSIKSLKDVNNMDWCGYIVECLKKTKRNWNGRGNFNGPLTFLAVNTICLSSLYLFYVHSTTMGKGNEKRNVPAIRYWKSEMLRTRVKEDLESGGFMLKPRFDSGKKKENLVRDTSTIGQMSYVDERKAETSIKVERVECIATKRDSHKDANTSIVRKLEKMPCESNSEVICNNMMIFLICTKLACLM
ncbi:hypothetical protein CTI12_AA414910 [Artemisia annua]|uniref:Uncharacterized protein n=1 Tax=Artemisia annua TaxID=35608 RepID=A0A2U1LS33_ARTAN|nr:hypothetical protein CTI12_AA414910 [Artemisia annua]